VQRGSARDASGCPRTHGGLRLRKRRDPGDVVEVAVRGDDGDDARAHLDGALAHGLDLGLRDAGIDGDGLVTGDQEQR
jgi:hypothetical protein